jgi:hypothetical protein
MAKLVFIPHWRLFIMTEMIREPECVLLKRRGVEHVAKLIEKMSQQEQLEFWQERTKAMLVRQKIFQQKKTFSSQNKEKG